MIKKKLTIHTKIIIHLMLIIFILGFSVIVFVKEFVSFRLTTELNEIGLCIARNLVSSCIEPILVQDLVKLQRLISDTKKSYKHIVYVFILNEQNMPVVHTFGNYFPKGLSDVSPIYSNETQRIQILNTEQGLVRDIALPILNGRLGTLHLGISEKYIQEIVFLIVIRLITIIGIIIVIGIVLTYFFAHRTLSPLKELTTSIKKIGEGDFQQKIDIKSEDEIGLLARTFNEMAEKLQKVNLELKNAQTKLIQAAKMATVGQFSAGIAHEINNPLAGTLNCVRSLLSDPEIKGQRRGYLELALKGLLRIQNTIEQILSFSGQQEFKLRLSDINQLLIESLEFIKHRLTEQKIVLEQKLSESLPQILCNPHQLQQVFMNVISNALDALPVGGNLSITTAVVGKNIEVKFIDNGKGIKEENLDKVFDPFFTTKEVGKGVGLGLFISYGIIQQHKGTIDIKSKENEGTTVTISLPILEVRNNVK
ncbi:MAG: sensor histidine kinase [Endomicrobiia bacterium]